MDDEINNGLLERNDGGSCSDKEGDVEPKVSSFRRDVVEIFIKYLDRCSITGVPFIRNSDHRSVKAAWSLLLFVAFCVMVGHLVLLFASYYEYKTHSIVLYTFNPLPFPAVTICNVNPVRKSMRKVSSEDWLFDIIGQIGDDKNRQNVPFIKMDDNSSTRL